MENPKGTVSSKQVIVAMFSMAIGSGILRISRGVTEAVGTPDAWLSVILGSVFAAIVGVIAVVLCNRYPGKTFFQFSTEIMGSIIGKTLNIVVSVLYVANAAFQTRVMAELVSTFLLIETPMKIVMVLFLWAGAYLAVGGLSPMLRSFEYYFPIIIILIAAILGLSMLKFEIDNMRPFLGKGIVPVLKGANKSFLSNAGIDILFVVIASMNKPKKAMRSMFTGVILIAFINTALVFISIGVLTVEEIQNLTWPLATLVNAIILPGASLENFNIFFVVIWLLCIFSTYVGSHFISGLAISQTFSVDYKAVIYVLLPIIYMVSVNPGDLVEVIHMGTLISQGWLIVGLGIPVMLLIVSLIRGREKETVVTDLTKKANGMKLNRQYRQKIVLMICIFSLFTSAGCWDRKEVEELGIILGIAIDSVPGSGGKNLFKITAQYVTPLGLSGSQAIGKQDTRSFYNLTRTGDSIFKILSDLYIVSSRIPNYEHLKVIIISKGVAETTDLYELLQAFLSYQEIPRNTFLVVSECEAASLLEEESELESMPLYEIDNLLRNKMGTSKKLYRQSFGDLSKEFAAGRSFALQRITKEETIVMEGTAIFRGDTNKMAGFLDEKETEGLNWLVGEAEFTSVEIRDKETGQVDTCTMSIIEQKIKPMIEGEDLSFRVEIWSEGLLMEFWSMEQDAENPEMLSNVEEQIAEQIKLRIESALYVLQKEYKADVAGFGKKLRIEDIEFWEELRDDWDNTFSEIPIEVNVGYHIIGYGRRSSN